MRPAHSSIVDFSCSWSFVFTWDAETGRTVGFFDGVTDADIDDILDHLQAHQDILYQPMVIPEMLLHMIIVHLNHRIRIPEENNFLALERRTEQSRIIRDQTVWTWQLSDFQDAMTRLLRFNATLSYLERRFKFAADYGDLLLEIIKKMSPYDYASRGESQGLSRRFDEPIVQNVRNAMREVKELEHQVLCMQKRSTNLTTAVRGFTLLRGWFADMLSSTPSRTSASRKP